MVKGIEAALVNAYMARLGGVLRDVRRSAAQTQKSMADAIGVSVPAYNAYEQGNNLTLQRLFQAAIVLDTRPNILLSVVDARAFPALAVDVTSLACDTRPKLAVVAGWAQQHADSGATVARLTPDALALLAEQGGMDPVHLRRLLPRATR